MLWTQDETYQNEQKIKLDGLRGSQVITELDLKILPAFRCELIAVGFIRSTEIFGIYGRLCGWVVCWHRIFLDPACKIWCNSWANMPLYLILPENSLIKRSKYFFSFFQTIIILKNLRNLPKNNVNKTLATLDHCSKFASPILCRQCCVLKLDVAYFSAVIFDRICFCKFFEVLLNFRRFWSRKRILYQIKST